MFLYNIFKPKKNAEVELDDGIQLYKFSNYSEVVFILIHKDLFSNSKVKKILGKNYQLPSNHCVEFAIFYQMGGGDIIELKLRKVCTTKSNDRTEIFTAAPCHAAQYISNLISLMGFRYSDSFKKRLPESLYLFDNKCRKNFIALKQPKDFSIADLSKIDFNKLLANTREDKLQALFDNKQSVKLYDSQVKNPYLVGYYQVIINNKKHKVLVTCKDGVWKLQTMKDGKLSDIDQPIYPDFMYAGDTKPFPNTYEICGYKLTLKYSKDKNIGSWHSGLQTVVNTSDIPTSKLMDSNFYKKLQQDMNRLVRVEKQDLANAAKFFGNLTKNLSVPPISHSPITFIDTMKESSEKFTKNILEKVDKHYCDINFNC